MDNICKFCGEGFFRKGKPSSSDKKMFCSKSCAAKFNNSKMPKRVKTVKVCSSCNRNPVLVRSKYCQACKESGSTIRLALDSVTLEYLKSNYPVHQYHSKVRSHARTVYARSGLAKTCKVCDYSKHVDICHIEDVSKFDLSTTLSDVNAIGNLVALCRNHHWEFDNDLLDDEDQEKLS